MSKKYLVVSRLQTLKQTSNTGLLLGDSKNTFWLKLPVMAIIYKMKT